MPFDQRSLIHREAWVPPCFVRQNQQKKKKIAQWFYTTSKQKCSNVRPLLSSTFPQGFRISKNFGHPTSGSGGEIGLKIYHMKRDRQTDKHTDIATLWKNRPRADSLKTFGVKPQRLDLKGPVYQTELEILWFDHSAQCPPIPYTWRGIMESPWTPRCSPGRKKYANTAFDFYFRKYLSTQLKYADKHRMLLFLSCDSETRSNTAQTHGPPCSV